MDAGLGSGIPDDTNRLAGSFARARVSLRPLSPHRQTPLVTHTAVTFDALETFQVHADFAAKITLDNIFAILDGMDNLRKLRLSQVLCADARINLCVRKDILRVGRPDAINIAQCNVDALLRRYFYANDTSHMIKFLTVFSLALTLFMPGIRANHTNNAFATNNFAIFAKLLN
jgi:hypothetical protein